MLYFYSNLVGTQFCNTPTPDGFSMAWATYALGTQFQDFRNGNRPNDQSPGFYLIYTMGVGLLPSAFH